MEAFYLKYRPQTLNDLIGQESVKKTLTAAYASKKLSHAYLLVGPRGCGKTSTARILAKMVNCELVQSSELVVGSKDKNSTNSPCNKCSTCVSITDGSNLDLIEIDAASNRGIEDIRVLRERIKLAPTSAKKKVYIIDEVHMLTTEAFNALLKTLEEPPAHVLFILATTEVSKVPQTILSRVQRLDFKLAIPRDLRQTLQKIIKEEKIDIEDEALEFLVKEASGSFRDGVKLLDQAASLGDKITAATILDTLKSSQFADLLDFVQNLAGHQTSDCLIEVNKQIEKGVDVKELTLQLLDLLRSLMLIKNGVGGELVKPQWTEDKYEKLVVLASKFNNHDLVHSLDVLQKAFEKAKFASISSLPLELAVVEICGEGTSKKLEVRSEKLDKEVRDEKIDKEMGSEYQESQDISRQNPMSHSTPPTSYSASSDILKLKEKWTFVLETIKPYNFSLEALLRSIKISECTDSTIILEVPYSFHQRILEAPKNHDLLEAILSDILGRQVRVSTVLGSHPTKAEDIANVEVAADDEIIRIAAEIFNSEPN